MRSVAPQIEIEGQDDGEEDDGAQDKDQDAVLDYPKHKTQRRIKTLRKGS